MKIIEILYQVSIIFFIFCNIYTLLILKEISKIMKDGIVFKTITISVLLKIFIIGFHGINGSRGFMVLETIANFGGSGFLAVGFFFMRGLIKKYISSVDQADQADQKNQVKKPGEKTR